MGAPFTMISGPFDVYVSPYGTAFPKIKDSPAAPWVLLGTNGLKSQAEGGVKITKNQTWVKHRTEGYTAPAKMNRTEEDLKVSFALVDLSPSFFALAMGTTVTAVASSGSDAGYDYVTFHGGPSADEFALYIRGFAGSSPENITGSTYRCAYKLPRCQQVGNCEIVHSKAGIAMVAFEYDGMVDSAQSTGAELGWFEIQKTA